MQSVSVAPKRPFRFACRVTGGRGRTAAEWVALALRAESLGYATFGVADHVATYYAPMPLLQLVAAHTSRIRLATLVLDNDFRHPVMLAKEAATLDVLSGGRLELGLGAGWLIDDYRQTGIPFGSGATRLAKLQEAVQVLKLLLGDPRTSFEGRFYSVHDLPNILEFETKVPDVNRQIFSNVKPVPRTHWFGRLAARFYSGALTYSMCYWNGTTGTVT